MLIDRQLQRRCEQQLGSGGSAAGEQEFSQQNARHHPVSFPGYAKLVVRNCLGSTPVGFQRLSQAETKEFVLRLLCDEGLKLGGA